MYSKKKNLIVHQRKKYITKKISGGRWGKRNIDIQKTNSKMINLNINNYITSNRIKPSNQKVEIVPTISG